MGLRGLIRPRGLIIPISRIGPMGPMSGMQFRNQLIYHSNSGDAMSLPAIQFFSKIEPPAANLPYAPHNPATPLNGGSLS